MEAKQIFGEHKVQLCNLTNEMKEMKERLQVIEAKPVEELPIPPPPHVWGTGPWGKDSIKKPSKEPPKFDIMIQGLPPFTLNTDIEDILSKIGNSYEGLRPPEIVKPDYRDKKGFLRFPNAESRKAFLAKLKSDPPKSLKVGDVIPSLSFKNAQTKEYRAKTKEIRWFGWAVRRPEVLGEKANDRKIFDTDYNKLTVLMCNKPVACFIDKDGRPIKEALDRTKHTFKVDWITIKECFTKLGIQIEVDQIVTEFEKTMSV
jgi:hypothetical protein